jgi:hypothetical protein
VERQDKNKKRLLVLVATCLDRAGSRCRCKVLDPSKGALDCSKSKLRLVVMLSRESPGVNRLRDQDP